MLTIQARFTDTTGKGVGRWRNYYKAEDMREALWCITHLVPKCQIRVKNGKDVVLGPCRAEEAEREREDRWREQEHPMHRDYSSWV